MKSVCHIDTYVRKSMFVEPTAVCNGIEPVCKLPAIGQEPRALADSRTLIAERANCIGPIPLQFAVEVDSRVRGLRDVLPQRFCRSSGVSIEQ